MDRDRLRERERQARAAMSVQAEQAAAGGGPDTRHHHHGHHNHAHHHANPHAVAAPLFRAPVKVSRSCVSFFPSLSDWREGPLVKLSDFIKHRLSKNRGNSRRKFLFGYFVNSRSLTRNELFFARARFIKINCDAKDIETQGQTHFKQFTACHTSRDRLHIS